MLLVKQKPGAARRYAPRRIRAVCRDRHPICGPTLCALRVSAYMSQRIPDGGGLRTDKGWVELSNPSGFSHRASRAGVGEFYPWPTVYTLATSKPRADLPGGSAACSLNRRRGHVAVERVNTSLCSTVERINNDQGY